MLLPSEIINFRMQCLRFSSHFGWCISTERSVNTFMIVVMLELAELAFEIHRIPEEDMIEIFSADRSY